MGKFIYQTLVSLDGYVSGPNDTLDWHVVTEDLHQVFNAEQQRFESYVFGRRTYETMRYWDDPKLLAPDNVGAYREFAARWVGMPKLVVSRSLDKAGPNARILRDNVVEELRSLREQSDGEISFGGGMLAASIRGEGLIDEYDLFVHPVVLGGGRQLFPPADERLDLNLIETKTYPQGVVRLRYAARQPGRFQSPPNRRSS